MIFIESQDNKTLKLIRSLQRKKGRLENGLYFAEGLRITQEALMYAEDYIKFVILSDEYAKKNNDFVDSIDKSGKTVYAVKERLFTDVCNTETPQGIGVVLKIPENIEFDLKRMKFVLILDGVSEPGNLGTIIRTAEATGIDGVYLMKGCADLYNPKVVRSTMGSLFRMKLLSGVDLTCLEDLKNNGFSIYATALNDSVSISETEKSEKTAVVIGSEAFGVSQEVLELADKKVRIDMEGRVESLNAAVAAGISMYMLKP